MPMRVKICQHTRVARTPITSASIHDGKYEPATVMSGPGRQPETAAPATAIATARTRRPRAREPAKCLTRSTRMSATVLAARRRLRDLARTERERHRGVEQLELRLDLLKVRPAQLSARREEVDEGPEPEAIGPKDRLVGALRSLDERARDVESPKAEPHVGVRLPHLIDRPIARRRYLLLGGAPLRLGELHLALTGSALEELPFQVQSRPVRDLSDAGPVGGGGADVVAEPRQLAANVSAQSERGEVVGAGTPEGGLL